MRIHGGGTVGCPKIGYATKREAKAALRACKAVAAAGYEHRREDHIYRCGCGSWHLTSLPHPDYAADCADGSPDYAAGRVYGSPDYAATGPSCMGAAVWRETAVNR